MRRGGSWQRPFPSTPQPSPTRLERRGSRQPSPSTPRHGSLEGGRSDPTKWTTRPGSMEVRPVYGGATGLGSFATAEEAAQCVARSPEGQAAAEQAVASSSHAIQAASADTAADSAAADIVKRARRLERESRKERRQEPPSTPRSNPGVTQWSTEEDKTLADAVKVQSFPDGVNWVGVAAWLEGRTPDACLQRWRYSVDPTIRRGKWTPEEDKLLRQGVAQHGAKEWARWVTGHMNGRTAPQCRERWVNSLDPNKRAVVEAPWTAEEDTALVKAVELLGTKTWSAVQRHAPQLQHRTDQHCKVRWVRHLEPTAAAGKIGKTGNVKWTDEEDKALSNAVAAHPNAVFGAVDWKAVHKALRPILPRRTIHHSPENLRTRWRNIINSRI
eukprot:scaffold109116_cov66-Phaeocystis_antarctica.AAC.2